MGLWDNSIDFGLVWTWTLLFVRISGLLTSLPAIGTDQVPMEVRVVVAMVFAAAVTVSGVSAPPTDSILEVLIIIGSEFALGYILGLIPNIIISGLGVAGQVTAGSMGLAQANMIDPSLGENVSVISRAQMLVGAIVFLFLDGHHAIIQAAVGNLGEFGLGVFRVNSSLGPFLLIQLVNSFEFAVNIAAPILATTLVTQFVLGLITKFIPQVNIFIISLPLTILIGFYIIMFTLPGMAEHLVDQFSQLEELSGQVLTSK